MSVPDPPAFRLHPRIAADTLPLAALKLCEARLQCDARWPWIVLVPRIADLREIEDLSAADRAQLVEEVVLAGHAVRAVGAASGRTVEKLNVGALGNVVAQLHVHVVGRRSDDAAWPGPVWGVGAAEAYAPDVLETAVTVARAVLMGRPAGA